MASPFASSIKEPQARACHAAIGVGSTMLVWGGNGNGDGKSVKTSTIGSFDVLNATWQDPRQLHGPSLPDGLRDTTVASDGKTAYVFGVSSGSLTNKLYAIDVASQYCRELIPAAGSAPPPSARTGSSMVYVRGRLVVYGGKVDGESPSDELHVFNLTTSEWNAQVTTGEAPPPLSGHTLTMIDQCKAVLFGGWDGSYRRNDTYTLDVETWRWSKIQTSGMKPRARSYHAACCIHVADCTENPPLLIVVGGWDGFTIFSDVLLLDVTDWSWNELEVPLASDITKRWGHSAVVFGSSPKFRVITLFGGNETLWASPVSETTLLELSNRRGSWLVNKVINSQQLEIPNEQMRRRLKKKLKLKPSTAEDRVIELERMLREERIRCQDAEERATKVDQRRQDTEQRVHEMGEVIKERERMMDILTQEKTDIIRQAEERDLQLQQAIQQVWDRERDLAEMHRQQQESETRLREREEALQAERQNRQDTEQRVQSINGHLLRAEQALREEADRYTQAEERVRDMEMRLRETIQGQREAEERMVEADNTKQQAEEREGDLERRVVESEQRQQQAEQRHREALHRSQTAENRLAVETRRRMEAQDLNRRLEERLQCGDDVFWRVERNEIQLSQEELGRGAWCKVMVAEFRGLQVAAKCLHSTIISNHNRQLFMREMNISAKLRHPNLVQFIGATVEGEPVILTELMTTSLREILEQGPLQLQQITSISCNVVVALNYMHLLRPDPILHRDVSSANILLNQGPGNTWVAKLSDCGSANFTRLVNTVGPGNPSYAAPEAADPSQQSPKMDVYSFGVTLMEMIIRQFPDRDHLAAQVTLVTEPRLLQLIQRCIDDNPARRPAIRDVLTELLL